MKQQFENFCRAYGLGDIIDEPKKLTGGLMHRMFKVQTDQGAYCIKVLNPEVMARPTALGNMIRSEEISFAMKDLVPLAAAKRFNGSAVLKHEQQYYMVFDFIEGASIYAPALSAKHCEVIGNLLGIIHKADISVLGIEAEGADAPIFDWTGYAQKAKGLDWADEYEKTLPKLIHWNKQAAEAAQVLAQHQVISHRDLDPKNVMWHNDQPTLIDWEAAGYINPYQELIELCGYWAADGNGGIDRDKFVAFTKAYSQHVRLSGVNWDPVLAGGMNGMLGWLEYNLKRAMKLINCSDEDQQLGIAQVKGTIQELYEYEEKSKIMKEWLEK